MKTARYFALAAAAAVIAGCSKQEPADIRPTDAAHEVYLTVKASSADTRTAISPDYAIRWAEGDAIGLFYNTTEIMAEWGFSEDSFTIKNGNIQNLYYPITSGAGSAAAVFSYKDYVTGSTRHPASGYYSGNFYWPKGVSQATLYAYYPYYYDTDCSSNYNVKYMPFHLPTTQTGSLDEVAENDLAYASATISRGADEVVRGEADFRFKHLFSILEITVENSLSAAVTVESVTVTAANDKALVGDCTLDLTKGEVAMGKRANSFGQIEGTALSSVLVSPDAGVTLQPKGSTTLYAVVAPCDLAGATVRVTTTAGYQDFTVTGITTEAGKYYSKSVALSDLTSTYIIDFEDVKLGREHYSGMVGDQNYDNILTAMVLDHGDWTGEDYTGWSGPIYTTGDGMAVFTGYYNDYGGYLPTWGAFAFSANSHDALVEGDDYAYQFSAVTSDKSANKFAITYDIKSLQMDRVDTAVDFTSEVNPVSVDVTNTAMMGGHMEENPAVTFVGYRSGAESGRVRFSLVDVKEWTEVSLRDLGSIDRLVVVMSGAEGNTPFYVCLDNLKYTIAE